MYNHNLFNYSVEFKTMPSKTRIVKVDIQINLQPTETNNNQHNNCSPNEKLNKMSTNEPEVGKTARSTHHSRDDVKQEAHGRAKKTRRRSKKNVAKVNEIHFVIKSLCYQY